MPSYRSPVPRSVSSSTPFEGLNCRCRTGKAAGRPFTGGGTIGGPGVEVTFPPVKAGKVRLAITDSTGGPTIWDFAVYPPG
ncbi:MAG: hypothetical protein KA354_23765 [Phycisphaerae bacterium]|nr:hypothetical protein [Phycisphaerae bacterium]